MYKLLVNGTNVTEVTGNNLFSLIAWKKWRLVDGCVWKGIK